MVYVLVKVYPTIPLSILIWKQASFMRAKHFLRGLRILKKLLLPEKKIKG